MSEEDRIKHMQVHGSADAYSEEDLWKKLQEYKVKATNTGNELTPPEPFNLMVTSFLPYCTERTYTFSILPSRKS